MNIALGLIAALIVLCFSQAVASTYDVLNVQKRGTRPNVHDTKECWYDEQRLDHFTYKPKDERWMQRYLTYQHYCKQEKKTGPIFFYGKFRACIPRTHACVPEP